MTSIDDPLWPHFKPLWADLSALNAGKTLIAGGYGLFLKQQWLANSPDQRIVVPIERWGDQIPRGTNDFDLLLDLELIADGTLNKAVLAALNGNGFEVTDVPFGQRWQFIKSLDGQETVKAELLAPTPDKSVTGLTVEDIRIKHRPSLGKEGIHGRHNREAVDSDLFPFHFERDQLAIAVPNPIAWAIMKLTAMHDQWAFSQNPETPANRRSPALQKAIKHARDVFRIVALTTAEERDLVEGVPAKMGRPSHFERAGEILRDVFSDEGWARPSVTPNWETDDYNTIEQVLNTWFSTESEHNV